MTTAEQASKRVAEVILTVALDVLGKSVEERVKFYNETYHALEREGLLTEGKPYLARIRATILEGPPL